MIRVYLPNSQLQITVDIRPYKGDKMRGWFVNAISSSAAHVVTEAPSTAQLDWRHSY
jgi:hypothetical protein